MIGEETLTILCVMFSGIPLADSILWDRWSIGCRGIRQALSMSSCQSGDRSAGVIGITWPSVVNKYRSAIVLMGWWISKSWGGHHVLVLEIHLVRKNCAIKNPPGKGTCKFRSERNFPSDPPATYPGISKKDYDCCSYRSLYENNIRHYNDAMERSVATRRQGILVEALQNGFANP